MRDRGEAQAEERLAAEGERLHAGDVLELEALQARAPARDDAADALAGVAEPELGHLQLRQACEVSCAGGVERRRETDRQPGGVEGDLRRPLEAREVEDGRASSSPPRPTWLVTARSKRPVTRQAAKPAHAEARSPSTSGQSQW